MNIANLLSRDVKFFYEENEEGGIDDSVHALGIVFTYVVPEDKELSAPTMWSTNAGGLFPKSIEPRMN